MQAAGAGIHPASGHRHRIVREHRGIFHAPLAQPHAFTVFQINRGYQQHSRFFQQRPDQEVVNRY
jgi:hypothetical protein